MNPPNQPGRKRYEISPALRPSEKVELARDIAFDIIHAAVNLEARQFLTVEIVISGHENETTEN